MGLLDLELMDVSLTSDALASTEMPCEESNDATNETKTRDPDSPVQDASPPKDVDTNNNKTHRVAFKEIIDPNTITEMNNNTSPGDCSECGSSSSESPTPTSPSSEEKPKELLTSFSRDGSQCTQRLSLNSTQLNSKLKIIDVFDHLSSMGEINHKGFNLPNFIVASNISRTFKCALYMIGDSVKVSSKISTGIASNLKSLGVEEIDCKEHVEAWLSQRRQRRWKQSLGHHTLNMFGKAGEDSFSCFQTFIGGRNSATELPASVDQEKSDTLTYFSPSQPNSSLLRLTGDGNVKLGQFLQKMEEVRGHLNNATCTFLQVSAVLTLPYLKLLSGNQLHNVCCKTFVDEWMQIVGMMAQDLKAESSKEVNMMLSREYSSLRTESKSLYKRLQKLYKKVYKIYQENERDGKPALQRLQPKSLPKFKGRRQTEASEASKSKENNNANKNTTVEEKLIPCVKLVQLAPVPLNRANVTITELFKRHIFFSKSKKGFLIFKTGIEEEWRRFSELTFNSRRELFLHVVDDLHGTLKLGTSIAGHVKELFIKGYPESIVTSIRENLKYLAKVSKEEDLLMLSKVTIANQVKSLHDSLTRLVNALETVRDIGKSFSKSIKQDLTTSNGMKPLWRRKSKFNSTASQSLTRDNINWEFDVNMALRFDNSRVRLIVPYTSSLNPFIDQFSTPFVE